MSSLKDLAIKYALENKWHDACSTNLQILEESPDNLDALNRLAFSYLRLSELDKAREIYGKVIAIDQTNPIALKNLKKIDLMTKITADGGQSSNGNSTFGLDNLYIEEAGKTKTIELKNIADRKTISQLQEGEMVALTAKRSKIFIQSQSNTYIGMLPDNIGMRLVSLIKGGNEYQACVKSISEKSITVFIRELKQSPKFKGQPSFIATSYHTK